MDASGTLQTSTWRFVLVILFALGACVALGGSSAWSSAASGQLAPPRSVDGKVERYVSGIADSLVLHSEVIFMNRSCGGELYGLPSHLERRLTTKSIMVIT